MAKLPACIMSRTAACKFTRSVQDTAAFRRGDESKGDWKDFRGTGGKEWQLAAVYKAHLEASQEGGCLWEAQAHAILDLDLTAEVS